mmetsp:Transcript_13206/g.36968  ORF Transcript_13206/g.36968 Transcript_13206/m.36968 type:complete len:308 (+) Transcript_13206:301-1224(+)
MAPRDHPAVADHSREGPRAGVDVAHGRREVSSDCAAVAAMPRLAPGDHLAVALDGGEGLVVGVDSGHAARDLLGDAAAVARAERVAPRHHLAGLLQGRERPMGRAHLDHVALQLFLHRAAVPAVAWAAPGDGGPVVLHRGEGRGRGVDAPHPSRELVSHRRAVSAVACVPPRCDAAVAEQRGEGPVRGVEARGRLPEGGHDVAVREARGAEAGVPAEPLVPRRDERADAPRGRLLHHQAQAQDRVVKPQRRALQDGLARWPHHGQDDAGGVIEGPARAGADGAHGGGARGATGICLQARLWEPRSTT